MSYSKIEKMKIGPRKTKKNVNTKKTLRGLQKKLIQTILKYFLPSSVIVS